MVQLQGRNRGDFVNVRMRPSNWLTAQVRETRPVIPGFAGHLPLSKIHYGSSHYGGVPLRGGGRVPLPHQGGLKPEMKATDLMGGGELGKGAELHVPSSFLIGRQAWDLTWAGHTRKRPPSTPRSLEARRRAMDTSSHQVRPSSAGTPRAVARQEQNFCQTTAEEPPLPSFRRCSYVPMSRDPRGPLAAHAAAVGGIRPGYTGFIPGVSNHYGSTHVGGSYERQDVALPGRQTTAWAETHGNADLRA